MLGHTGLYWSAQELPCVERLLDEAPRPPRWLRRVAGGRCHPAGDQQRYWFILVYGIQTFILVYTSLYWEVLVGDLGGRFRGWLVANGQPFVLVCTGLYWPVLSRPVLVYTGLYWFIPVYSGPYWSMLVYTSPYWSVLVHTGLC